MDTNEVNTLDKAVTVLFVGLVVVLVAPLVIEGIAYAGDSIINAVRKNRFMKKNKIVKVNGKYYQWVESEPQA